MRTHEARPGRRRPGHWWEILTRTLAGRLALLGAGVAMIGIATAGFSHFVLGAFPSFGEGLWSAVAHLVDPGSIGDDDTAAERVVGLVQVIAGIIFFAGVVLTLLTEVVDRALRSLRGGDPAVRRQDHLLIVGFNPSLREVQRRLRENLGPVPPEIVVMLPLTQADRREDARLAVAGYPVRASVVVADPGDDGYERVCALDARHIVILSPDGEPDAADLEATDRAVLLDEYLGRPASGAPAVAVEMRRGRNARALWFVEDPDAGSAVMRFPPNFDALVNDRNIGALLTLAVTNPDFADVFLDVADPAGPILIPADESIGLRFGEARDRLEDYRLIGLLGGEGPDAEASYLPGDEVRLQAGVRLIVMPAESPTADPKPGASPGRVTVQPRAPGSVLLVGWSDASLALVEDLGKSGADPGRVHLLDRHEPMTNHEVLGPAPLQVVEGDPFEPADIQRAISLVEPDIIWVAAPRENESGAIISGMLARQASDVPVIVEQSFADEAEQSTRVAAGILVVSTAAMVADSVALSLSDPAVIVAREGMLNDQELALQSLVYRGPGLLPVAALPALLGSETVPLTVSTGNCDSSRLEPGDRILALSRTARDSD